jgi:hypothetical protein
MGGDVAAPPLVKDSSLRVCERQACNLRTSCHPVAARTGADLLWSAKVRDISPRGVGLVLDRRFEPGTALAIEVPEAPARPAETLLVRVAHATELPGGQWLLGCSFLNELGSDEIQLLLSGAPTATAAAGPPQPAAVERVNVDCNPDPGPPGMRLRRVEKYFTLPGVQFRWADGGTAAVLVRRLSVKGLWPLPAGAVVGARVSGPDGKATQARLKVCSCAQEEGRWTVVYALVGQPPAEFLSAFGIGH